MQPGWNAWRGGRVIALVAMFFCARGLAQDVGGDDEPAGTQPGGVPAGYRVPLANGDTGIHKWVTALAADAKGIVWIGTEADGLWRWDRGATGDAQWKLYGVKDGLGDETVGAIAVDKLGRVWAGHLNHGVSVFNGEKWQNYNVAAGIGRADAKAGPIGERVFAITTSPLDGDVWMATSAGLNRYSLKTEVWRSYTRADGLPADQAYALAFDSDGRLFVGTQCDGIAIGTAADDYASWQSAKAVDLLPHAPTGRGLPSNQINAVLATHGTGGGTVYAGTALGLAKSVDHGKSWAFVRGADWDWKGEPAATQVPWKTLADEKLPAVPGLMPEDCVMALGEDAEGRVWAGTRQHGYVMISPKGVMEPGVEMKVARNKKTFDPPLITAILPLDDETLIGAYQGGLRRLPRAAGSGVTTQPLTTQQSDQSAPALPNEAAAPDIDAMKAMGDAIEKVAKATTLAVFEGEDWRTQGNWVARYGKQYAVLCSGRGAFDEYISNGSIYYHVQGLMGPHHAAGDGLRRWLQADADPHALWDPVAGHRSETEWDDHGEMYPMWNEGPDVNAEVTVPAGVARVSLYLVNLHGQVFVPRLRDYLIEVRKVPGELGAQGGAPVHGPLASDPPGLPPGPIAMPSTASVSPAWYASPVLARARVKDFYGGVYKSFDVSGPGTFLLTIRRNWSWNTICSGVFIDRLSGPTTSLDKGVPLELEGPAYAAPTVPEDAAKKSETVAAAMVLIAKVDAAQGNLAAAPWLWKSRVAAYRAAADGGAPQELLENWRWVMRTWTPDDLSRFDKAMADIVEFQMRTYPSLHEGGTRPTGFQRVGN